MKTAGTRAQTALPAQRGGLFLHIRDRARDLASRVRNTRTRLARWPAPVIVFAVCLLVYSYRPLVQSSMDNQPLRFGSVLLAYYGSLDYSILGLDPNIFYSLRRLPDGKVVAHTPIGSAYLGAPFFLIARLVQLRLDENTVVFVDSVAASTLTAAAAAMLAWLVRRHGRRTSLFLGLACGLATASWSVASRCLWQHTGAQFSLLVALCLFDDDRKRAWRVAAGVLMLGVAVWCRPYLAGPCTVIMAYALRRNWRLALAGVAAIAVGGALWIGYNLTYQGSPVGSYLESMMRNVVMVQGYPGRLAGSLLSPNRGLFVFSPLLLLAIPAMASHFRQWRSRPHEVTLGLAALTAILARGLLQNWHGGHTYGARFMLDASPFLLLLMAPLVSRILSAWNQYVPVALFLFALSAGIQYLGVARDFQSWNIMMKMENAGNAWNWRKTQIMHCLTHGQSTRGPLLDPSVYMLPSDGVMRVRGNPGSLFVRSGVIEVEPWGPWLMPPVARLAVTLPARLPVRMKVDITTEAYPFDPTRVEVYWNDRQIGDLFFLRKDWQFQNLPEFPIRAQDINPGINFIEFRVSKVYYKGASPQPLGVAIDKITILPE